MAEEAPLEPQKRQRILFSPNTKSALLNPYQPDDDQEKDQDWLPRADENEDESSDEGDEEEAKESPPARVYGPPGPSAQAKKARRKGKFPSSLKASKTISKNSLNAMY
jgi:hypothetical protein